MLLALILRQLKQLQRGGIRMVFQHVAVDVLPSLDDLEMSILHQRFIRDDKGIALPVKLDALRCGDLGHRLVPHGKGDVAIQRLVTRGRCRLIEGILAVREAFVVIPALDDEPAAGVADGQRPGILCVAILDELERHAIQGLAVVVQLLQGDLRLLVGDRVRDLQRRIAHGDHLFNERRGVGALFPRVADIVDVLIAVFVRHGQLRKDVLPYAVAQPDELLERRVVHILHAGDLRFRGIARHGDIGAMGGHARRENGIIALLRGGLLRLLRGCALILQRDGQQPEVRLLHGVEQFDRHIRIAQGVFPVLLHIGPFAAVRLRRRDIYLCAVLIHVIKALKVAELRRRTIERKHHRFAGGEEIDPVSADLPIVITAVPIRNLVYHLHRQLDPSGRFLVGQHRIDGHICVLSGFDGHHLFPSCDAIDTGLAAIVAIQVFHHLQGIHALGNIRQRLRRIAGIIGEGAHQLVPLPQTDGSAIAAAGIRLPSRHAMGDTHGPGGGVIRVFDQVVAPQLHVDGDAILSGCKGAVFVFPHLLYGHVDGFPLIDIVDIVFQEAIVTVVAVGIPVVAQHLRMAEIGLLILKILKGVILADVHTGIAVVPPHVFRLNAGTLVIPLLAVHVLDDLRQALVAGILLDIDHAGVDIIIVNGARAANAHRGRLGLDIAVLVVVVAARSILQHVIALAVCVHIHVRHGINDLRVAGIQVIDLELVAHLLPGRDGGVGGIHDELGDLHRQHAVLVLVDGAQLEVHAGACFSARTYPIQFTVQPFVPAIKAWYWRKGRTFVALVPVAEGIAQRHRGGALFHGIGAPRRRVLIGLVQGEVVILQVELDLLGGGYGIVNLTRLSRIADRLFCIHGRLCHAVVVRVGRCLPIVISSHRRQIGHLEHALNARLVGAAARYGLGVAGETGDNEGIVDGMMLAIFIDGVGRDIGIPDVVLGDLHRHGQLKHHRVLLRHDQRLYAGPIIIVVGAVSQRGADGGMAFDGNVDVVDRVVLVVVFEI